jgi:uncharacterized membrane protein YagU involved in acid resistance
MKRFRGVAPLIVKVWLIAGTLDIADALVFNWLRGVTPAMVFRYIASGVTGPTAVMHGGLASVVLGVVLHYSIALIWTIIFYAITRELAMVSNHPAISGLLYGCLVYLIMNYIVLPLSRVPHLQNRVTVASRINGVLAVLLCIGLTISLLFSRKAAAQ